MDFRGTNWSRIRVISSLLAVFRVVAVWVHTSDQQHANRSSLAVARGARPLSDQISHQRQGDAD